jgi:hypothetical protein
LSGRLCAERQRANCQQKDRSHQRWIMPTIWVGSVGLVGYGWIRSSPSADDGYYPGTFSRPRRNVFTGRDEAVYKTTRAAGFLIKAPFILAMLFVINLMTSPGHWWVQWAALGIGIAWVMSLFRVIRAIIVAGGLAALAAVLLRQRQSARGGLHDILP